MNTTRDAHLAEARRATRGTGCLPTDSLLSTDSLCNGHFTTMNLERKGHRAQGIRRQVNRTHNFPLGVDHGRIPGQIWNRAGGYLVR